MIEDYELYPPIEPGEMNMDDFPDNMVELCDHRDGYGSTIIMGEHVGDDPVCMLCERRFPKPIITTGMNSPEYKLAYEQAKADDRVLMHLENELKSWKEEGKNGTEES